MKKRLLSAALALAMVLTMLPLTAFAANPTEGTAQDADSGLVTVSNYTSKVDSTATNSGHGIGLYYSKSESGVTTYYKVESGVTTSLNSGKWYKDIDGALDAGVSTIFLLSNQSATKVDLIKNVTIDVRGKTLSGAFTIKAKYTNAKGDEVSNSMSSLTIKDSSVSGSTMTDIVSASVQVGETGADKAKNGVNVTLQNVKTSGTITADYVNSCTVNLTNAKCGDITLTGKTSGGTVNVGTSGARGEAGAVTVDSPSGGVVNVNDGTTTSITLKGSGTKLNSNGATSSLGTITVFGRTAGSLSRESEKDTLSPASIDIKGGSVNSIGKVTGGGDVDVLTKEVNVKLSGNVSVTTGITLPIGKVVVESSAAGAIDVDSGSVEISGTATGPASATTISLGASGTKANLTVKGQKVTTGNITVVTGGTADITIPNDDTNTFGTITANGKITNQGISGGVFGGPVPAGALKGLTYQVKNDTKYTYYASNQFQKLIDAYASKGTDFKITLLKDSTAGTGTNTITFKNGTEASDILTVITYGANGGQVLGIELPWTVNGSAVGVWTESDANNNVLRDITKGMSYTTPSTPANRVLNTQISESLISAITGLSTTMTGIKVQLVGNTITLSGAVNQSAITTIPLDIVTDGKPSVDADINVLFDSENKTTKFEYQTGLPGGMTISSDGSTLRMPNDANVYTVNGSGLSVKASKLDSTHILGYTGDVPVVVNASRLSGIGWTTVSKEALAAQLSSTITGGTLASGTATVSFAGSPSVKEALNAAVAKISDSNLDSWVLAAQNKAWRQAGNSGTPTEAQRNSTGFTIDSVYVVAYLYVDISNYNTANNPGTMTATLTPYYRVELRQGNVDSKFVLPAGTRELIPQSGTLGSLTGDIGSIVYTPNFPAAFNTTDAVAHQNSTYAYPYDGTTKAFTITHAPNGALGTIVINGEGAMVTLQVAQGDTSANKYYDTLQAAVDDAEEGNYINVDANYKGSCAISVTGKARKFKINTNGANRVTSNVTGTVTELTGGTLYEVQLERDNYTNAGIAVGSAANGTASVNVTSAKPGSSVSGTYKANSGYKAGTFSATAQPGNKSVSVSVSANGTFSFTVPSDATSVTVTPSFVLDNGLPFTDVATNAWYFTAVKYCYDTTNNGYRLMEGDSAATFAPNGSFTRAHMVQILWNMKGRPTPRTTANPFRDMSSSNWYYSAVLWAYENGYAKGYPDGTFKPGQAVTRQEMVQFLYQASGSPSGSGNLSYYSDGYTANNWAQPALRWATGLGILSGQNSASLGNTLAPRAVAKRCEVAVTVMNFDKLNLF